MDLTVLHLNSTEFSAAKTAINEQLLAVVLEMLFQELNSFKILVALVAVPPLHAFSVEMISQLEQIEIAFILRTFRGRLH